jgi:hypothetical protein
MRPLRRALLGANAAGTPDAAQLDAQLGESAEEIKALHPGGAQQWRSLVGQTAPMWLDRKRTKERSRCLRTQRPTAASP